MHVCILASDRSSVEGILVDIFFNHSPLSVVENLLHLQLLGFPWTCDVVWRWDDPSHGCRLSCDSFFFLRCGCQIHLFFSNWLCNDPFFFLRLFILVFWIISSFDASRYRWWAWAWIFTNQFEQTFCQLDFDFGLHCSSYSSFKAWRDTSTVLSPQPNFHISGSTGLTEIFSFNS